VLNWRTVVRNVFCNWVSYFVTAVLGFLLTPVIVHSLGNTGYGLWTLVLSLTGYFGLLDLGIRSSLGRFVARHVAMKNEEMVNRTVSTALAMLGLGGLATLTLTAIVAHFFLGSFNVGAEFHSAGKAALLLAGINVACVLPLGVFAAVLVGIERFDIISGITTVGALTRAASVVVLLRSGHGLLALAAVSFLVSMAEYTAMAIAAKRLYKPLRMRFSLVDRATFSELFGFSIYRFIWIAATQLIFYTDSVVIGAMLGAAAITTYAIAASLINYGRTVVSLLTDTFYPAATRMDAQKDIAGLRELLFHGTRIALLVACPLCLGYVFLGRQFISLWMGKEYASSAVLLAVLAIAQLSAMSQNVSALILAGMAKHRILAYIVFAEGVTNLVLSIILVRQIGVIGVAWGTVLPNLVCTAVIIPLYTTRLLGVPLGTYWKKAFAGPLLASIPAAALAFAFSVLVPQADWFGFAAEALALCGVFAVAAYFLCLEAGQRMSIQRRIHRTFNQPVRYET
jgi:O-antigen/teichoic acid export membrane protein